MRLLIAIAALWSSVAHAEPPQVPQWPNEANAASCSASFNERLDDAREAIAENQEYMKVYDRFMPWFKEHCRFLTELEIAVRKLDDSNAFVCDTGKGRPAGMTSQIVADHQFPTTAKLHQEYREASLWCEPFDAAERISLVLRDSDPRTTIVRQLEVTCWKVESEDCAKARVAMAARPSQPPRPR